MLEAEFIVSSVQPTTPTDSEVLLQAHRCNGQACAEFPSLLGSGKLTLVVPHLEAAAKFQIGRTVSLQIKITF